MHQTLFEIWNINYINEGTGCVNNNTTKAKLIFKELLSSNFCENLEAKFGQGLGVFLNS
jgi:hypothetical protein